MCMVVDWCMDTSCFANWDAKQPNENIDNMCAKIENDADHLYPWLEHRCSDAFAFVCEMDACLSGKSLLIGVFCSHRKHVM